MKNAIIEALNNLDNSDLIAIHNEYCDACNDPDSCIYDMYDLNEMLASHSPSDIAVMIFYGSFNPNDDYFTFDGYGNLASFNYPLHEDASRVCVEELAEFVCVHDEDYGIPALREALDAEVASDEE